MRDDTIPIEVIPQALTQAAEYRQWAAQDGNLARYDKWCQALDNLLDQWLQHRPDLRWKTHEMAIPAQPTHSGIPRIHG